jgi:uncharacterized membrane protein
MFGQDGGGGGGGGVWVSKLLIYGLIGLLIEVVFTGVWSAIVDRDRAATARTYLWMHPIYGATALFLEWVYERLAGAPMLLRGVVYLAIIYGAEYGSGFVLRWALGRCPWDYGERRAAIHGLIRLDYAPAWFVVGLGAEAVQPLIRSLAAALSTPDVAIAALSLLGSS